MSRRRAAVILAGGDSNRMGQPKAWLSHGGETLLHRVVRIAMQACPLAVVVGAPGQSLPPVPDGALRIDDDASLGAAGPLLGACSGLRTCAELGSEVAYVGACDAAWLSAVHVESMLQRLERDSTALAVVPESGPFEDGTRIVHATSGVVRVPVARDTAAALLRAGQGALRRLYEGLGARRVAVASLPDPEAISACNTPEQWAAAQRRWAAPQ